jgi:serine/threonine protein kinase
MSQAIILLNHWQIVREMGGGLNEGATLVKDTRNGELQVLKTFAEEMNVDDGEDNGIGNSATQRGVRFKATVEIYRSLSADSTNLVQMLEEFPEYPEKGHVTLLLSPFCNGDSLVNLVDYAWAHNKVIPENFIRHCLISALKGLKALQQQGLYHGDAQIGNGWFHFPDKVVTPAYPQLYLGDYMTNDTRVGLTSALGSDFRIFVGSLNHRVRVSMTDRSFDDPYDLPNPQYSFNLYSHFMEMNRNPYMYIERAEEFCERLGHDWQDYGPSTMPHWLVEYFSQVVAQNDQPDYQPLGEAAADERWLTEPDVFW